MAKAVSGFNGCAVSMADAVSMPAAFLGLRPFESLAYAELKVNFVEGFAVLAALFNFVEGFAVLGLTPVSC